MNAGHFLQCIDEQSVCIYQFRTEEKTTWFVRKDDTTKNNIIL